MSQNRRRKHGYTGRDMILKEMGWESYGEYLKSDLWQEVRGKVFERGRRCYVCRRRGRATQVHHVYYSRENLSGESTRGMVPICGTCHSVVEFEVSGRKLTAKEARKKTRRLAKYRGAANLMREIERKRRIYRLRVESLDDEMEYLIRRDG